VSSKKCDAYELKMALTGLMILPLHGLRHLHSVQRWFYCPQLFLGLDFQCRDDVSEFI